MKYVKRTKDTYTVQTFHFLYTYIFNYYVDVAITAFVEHVL